MPAFRGDVGVKDGKIVEIGKLSGPAAKTIDADGRAVAPGFIDNHCHYDAQVTWDPLCTFSPEHGATTVIFGNCSLSLAPVRKGTEERLAEFLSYVEAIPMEVLKTVEFDWETIRQYMEQLDNHLGINVGNLIGHSAVRHYVMGDDCQKAGATDSADQGDAGCRARRHAGRRARPVGVAREGPFRSAGRAHPGAVGRREGDLRARRRAARNEHRHDPGRRRPVCRAEGRHDAAPRRGDRPHRRLQQPVADDAPPDEWKEHMARIEETAALGIRAYPMCSPNRVTQDFTMKNCQVFRGLPTWHPILLMSDEEKLRLYADPEIRAKLHEEAVVNKPDSAVGISKTWWNYIWVNEPVLEKNKWMQFKSIGQIAEKQGKRVIDAFLDLVVEEKLETRFLQAENNIDDEALTKILTHPNAVIGLGDGGAHVQFHGGYGYLTKLLGEWVREKQVMTLGAGGAAADLRLGLDLRPLRPRPVASGHGGRHRDLRPGHRQMRQGRGRARLPGRRLAHQGDGGGRLATRSSTARCCYEDRKAHRRAARPRPAQQLLARQPRIRIVRVEIASLRSQYGSQSLTVRGER